MRARLISGAADGPSSSASKISPSGNTESGIDRALNSSPITTYDVPPNTGCRMNLIGASAERW